MGRTQKIDNTDVNMEGETHKHNLTDTERKNTYYERKKKCFLLQNPFKNDSI